MNDLLVVGNLLEAMLWLGFSGIFSFKAWQTSGKWRRLWLVLAIAFVAFAVSDVIESQTGAWWRPLWLLAIKGGCIVVFLWSVREYRLLRTRPHA